MSSTQRRPFVVVFALLLQACGGGAPPSADASVDGSLCTPSREVFNTSVRPLIELHCARCHGATPAFGAPYSLLDYDALVRSTTGVRALDRIAPQLVMGAMPPASAPAMPDDARRSVASWASCGAMVPVPGTGVRASVPVFQSPTRPLAGVASFDLRARNFAVARDVEDLYQCFVFEAPVTEDRFIRRFELVLSDARVVHHVVLLRDPDRTGPSTDFVCNSMPASSQYLYAWAPGQSAFEFPEGGLRVRPRERFILQIHYNNGARVPGVVDNSGVRVFHDAPGGSEYGMVALGPVGFQIAARSQGNAESFCTVRVATRMLAGMPHMHEVGTDFVEEIVRADGRREPLITLSGWRFETQLFYDLAKTFAPGDRIRTRCTYNNTTSSVVRSGSGTRDEMCFNFAYVTPPPTTRYCDEGSIDTTQVTYVAGACAQPGPVPELPLVSGTLRVGDGPTLSGGTLVAGNYVLRDHTVLLNMLGTGLGDLDLMQSTLRSRGRAWVSAGRLAIDVVGALHAVVAGGASLDRGFPISVGGTFDATGQSPLMLRGNCGITTQVAVPYSADATSFTVSLPPQNFGMLRLTTRLTFQREP